MVTNVAMVPDALMYPTVLRDVSMLVPLHVTVEAIEHTIKAIDTRIVTITLIDFFTKKEWVDQKSLTFACVISDPNKTFEKQEIDTIWAKVEKALKKLGATIR